MSTTTHPLAAGHPPRWACAWGHDKYGPYADLAVGRVKQRFRWCPPGSFMMGSPEAEVGRDSNEDVPHSVAFASGFWIADSAVTQSLWGAVMGTNPSQLVDPANLNRPVQTVGWNDAMEFCARLEARVKQGGLSDDGLVFRFPSEAEWEYACRAGTTTSTYVGDIVGHAESDRQTLDSIAWYHDNLRGKGQWQIDQVDQLESDRPVERSPVHYFGPPEVKGKVQNAWGIYDMLGTVDEWCAAGLGGQEVPYVERVAPDDWFKTRRVYRGGGYQASAHRLRAAARSWVEHARYASGDLGFRLCRGPAHQTSPFNGAESG
jgi:sulfatase modifying factor 1